MKVPDDIVASPELHLGGDGEIGRSLGDRSITTPPVDDPGRWRPDERGPADLSLAAADAMYTGESESDLAGDSLAGPGDVDGDGFDDMLVGASSSDAAGTEAGAAYMVLGSTSPAGLSLAMSDARFVAEFAGDNAGSTVSGAGDTDGDGFADFLIGAPYNDTAGTTATWYLAWVNELVGKSSAKARGPRGVSG